MGNAPAAVPGAVAIADVAWLEGIWMGTEWESAASIYQGALDLTVTFGANATWSSVDKSGRRSAGLVRIERGLVALDRWTGEHTPIHCTLAVSPDRQHLFGTAVASFGGRRAPATISLERVPSRP
jgi:hypothetical protein